ncbi:autotransporter domain-containing protein [Sphingomonas naphthae]|uniref:Autotransporter domain-containing protein n=1 Tax=Sphingomonas naphthae TaxID=1813468 RepID=A0ABY7TIE1_9SPHN|nr:autotransporter domain-containing protein [Sphingomonas naphthae]WCT72808.1 autotransporter domain-containing protein [Sphingomonas naphthae]
MTLTNTGSIIGSIAGSTAADTVSLVGGSVQGGVSLGAGDDRLFVDAAAGPAFQSNITGAIDGGTGIDTIQYRVATDLAFTAPPLPTNFEQVQFDLVGGARVTLSGVIPSGGYALTGMGGVTMNGPINASGPIITAGPSATGGSTAISFINRGTIGATLGIGSSTPAIFLPFTRSFENSGFITAERGDAVRLEVLQNNASVLNSGSIIATGLALSTTGALQNSGTIRSTAGQALYLYLQNGATREVVSTNTGTIAGNGIGVQLAAVTLVNRGTIDGGAGIGIIPSRSSTIDNQAGGVVSGQNAAIKGTLSGPVEQAIVRNAGTIRGNVDFTEVGSAPLTSADIYSDAGGTIAGNLILGAGDDILFTDLVQTVGRPFAGVSGIVDPGAGNDLLRLRVTTDASSTIAPQRGFERVAFDVLNGARLTLTGSGVSATPLLLTGQGSVDLTADFAMEQAAIVLTGRNELQTLGLGAGLATNLSVTSRGVLTSTNLIAGVVQLGTNSSFTNAGAINYQAGTTPGFQYGAIQGGASVANSGTINISGANAINTQGSILNSGTITQTAGGNAMGVLAIGNIGAAPIALTNSGTIDVSDIAAFLSHSTGTARVVNSGRIVSSRSTAISMTGRNLRVENGVDGVISGGSGLALNLSGPSVVVNAGRIEGSVQLNGPTGPIGPGWFQANGGTVTGSVIFGRGNDTFVARNGITGVSGVINAGAGYDTFVSQFVTNGSLTLSPVLPQSFEAELVEALGDAVVTVNGPTSPLTRSIGFTGDGTIISNVNVTAGAANAPNLTYLNIGIEGSPTGPAFTNNGNLLGGLEGEARSIVNNGTISTPANSAAISLIASDLEQPITIANAGTITGPTAINAVDYVTTLRNTGTITGNIRLGTGDDLIENRGTITGDVFLGDGNDSFLQLAGAMNGTVDGGAGIDSLFIDASQSGTVNASNFLNFERFSQTGGGNAIYSGAFTAESFGLAGGTLTVAAGGSLTSSNATTISGSATAERIVNEGAISGGIDLGDGVDSVVNRGTIGGDVLLGAGNDSFTQGATSSVGGIVDGGTGIDTYIAEIAGDRTGIGRRTNFEVLGVTGVGNLSLALDQNWQAINLSGVGLNLTLGGFSPGTVSGSGFAERLTADGDIASVSLGAGDDLLSLGATTLAGRYDGGTGTDIMRLTSAATLSGTITGFETIDLTGGALTVAGTGSIGSAGTITTFVSRPQSIAVRSGGTLLGDIVLGSGNTSMQVDGGANITGNVVAGAGSDVLRLVNNGGTMAVDAAFIGFEDVAITGGGTVQLNKLLPSTRLTFDGNLTVGTTASVYPGTMTGSAGANILTIAGTFAGAVDLGAGNDTLRFTGTPSFNGSASGGAGSDTLEFAVAGTDAAPVSFGLTAFTDFETLRMASGVVSLAGNRTFERIDVVGGRLIGTAGSVFTAPQIAVAAGATFGTAGSVVGNIAVAGTLSPGASPGTMSVTGNVSLASGSTTLFELTPTVSDQLLISGNLAIASGATLTLTGNRPLTPGVTLDLIVANGGITGSFATVNQPATIGGFLSQSATKLSLLGTFLTSPGFTPQVNRTIAGVNALLVSGQASGAVIAAVPQLLSGGATNPAAFRQLSPEPYASATALGIDNGLAIVDSLRAQVRSARTSTGLFSFAQAFGYRHPLRGAEGEGVARTRAMLGGGYAGIGIGTENVSVGAFVGYSDSRMRTRDLSAHLDGRGLLAGVQADGGFGGFRLAASFVYDATRATLDRTVLGSAAKGRFDLHGRVGDVSLRYAMALAPGWTLQPQAGLSYVRSRRQRLTETGATPFRLSVAGGNAKRLFADGSLNLSGDLGGVRPSIGAGIRRRIAGDEGLATAAFAGTTPTFVAYGVQRDRTTALGNAGVTISLSPALDLSAGYTGEFGNTKRHSGTVGLRFAM